MTGQPGRSGGHRENTGGKREGAGRPKNAPDVTVSPGRFMPLSQKWKYAERALQYADEMLDILVAIARDGETDAAHCERITRSPRRRWRATPAVPQCRALAPFAG
jgi:hypothetical protein